MVDIVLGSSGFKTIEEYNKWVEYILTNSKPYFVDTIEDSSFNEKEPNKYYGSKEVYELWASEWICKMQDEYNEFLKEENELQS